MKDICNDLSARFLGRLAFGTLLALSLAAANGCGEAPADDDDSGGGKGGSGATTGNGATTGATTDTGATSSVASSGTGTSCKDTSEQCYDNGECCGNACLYADGAVVGFCSQVCESFADCPSFWDCDYIGNGSAKYCIPSE